MQQLTAHFLQTFLITVFRYFIIAGTAFFIFYKIFLSRFNNNKIQKRQAQKTDFFREISYSILSTLVFATIGVLLLFTPIMKYTLLYKDVHAYSLWWIPVSVVLALIIHDTYFYWMHRLLHSKLIFKHAHLVHHKSVNPSPWASYSFHFLESIIEGGILVVVALVLPMHLISLLLFIIAGFVINVYGHLGYEIMPQKFRQSFWFQVLNTSVHHNMHHSKFKGNYGLYFRVWDQLMKTEHPDYVSEYDRIQEQRFGPKKMTMDTVLRNVG